MKKKILSLVLAMCMIVAVVPTMVFASNNQSSSPITIKDAPSEHERSGWDVEWSESFEHGVPSTWQNIDKDGDGYKWWKMTEEPVFGDVSDLVHHGTDSIHSNSYIRYYKLVLEPDNWLILPEQNLSAAKNYTLTFDILTPDLNYSKDKIGIYVSTDGGNSYNQLGNDFDLSQGESKVWYEVEVDLSDYSGEKVSIVIVHHNSRDEFMVVIDCMYMWSTNKHTCVFDEQKYNDTEHWMQCSCGLSDPNSKAPHAPKSGDCTSGIRCECGYEMVAPTTGHDWGEWTHVLTTHTRQCKNQYCKIVETKNCKDNNNDHNCDVCGGVLSTCEDNNNDHKCDLCGKALTTCEDNDNDHNCDICGKAVSTCADNDKDHNCDICGKVLSQHSGGKATCTQKAKCEYCGKEYGDFDKTNHAGGTEIKNRYSSSCSSSGYTGDEYCLGCGELIKKGYSTSSSGHYGGVATCKDKAKCLSCGSEYGETDLSNHSNLVYVAPKDATRKKSGNTEYWYCDGCGKYFADANAQSEISQSDTVIAKLAKAKSENDKADNKATDETATVKNSSSKKSPLTGSGYFLLPSAMIASGLALILFKKKKQTEI